MSNFKSAIGIQTFLVLKTSLLFYILHLIKQEYFLGHLI